MKTVSHDDSQEKEERPYVLCPTQLAIGDVILSTQPKGLRNLGSWVIRTVTDSKFSHAAIHVGGGFLAEAVYPEGVRLAHARRFIFPNPNQVCILRHNAEEHVLHEVAGHAKSLVFRPYSIKKALVSLLPALSRDENGRFCSELVAESFSSAGVNLKMNLIRPDKITPAYLQRCDDFSDVTEVATRALQTKGIERALKSLQERTSALPERKFKTRTEDLESICLCAAAPLMRKYSFFKPPYHLVDVFRQLGQHVNTRRVEVEEIDSALSQSLIKADIENGSVRPREAIPELTVAINSDHVLRVLDAGETQADAKELQCLAADLLSGRNWHLEEIGTCVDEANSEANRTKLKSIRDYEMLLSWEKWYAENTYRVVKDISEAVVVSFD